jgi:hypothetical protein
MKGGSKKNLPFCWFDMSYEPGLSSLDWRLETLKQDVATWSSFEIHRLDTKSVRTLMSGHLNAMLDHLDHVSTPSIDNSDVAQEHQDGENSENSEVRVCDLPNLLIFYGVFRRIRLRRS